MEGDLLRIRQRKRQAGQTAEPTNRARILQKPTSALALESMREPASAQLRGVAPE